MNKIFKFTALISVCLMAFAGCAPEELNTDQYSDEAVTFAGFAPNPVARGGALRITGSNLQKVNEVILPGVDPITNIEVVSEGRQSEIRVIVPVDGPEVGKIAIVAEGKTYQSLAELTYSEPIFFTDFSPKDAMPGDEITLKGDYLNNIRVITFAGDTEVKEFVSQSRYEMKVVVPATAVTGKIILADVDPENNPDNLIANLFYSEEELVIGEPTVKSADRGVLKAGANVIVSGEYLDMIQSVNYGGVAAEFTVAEGGKSLTAVLPANAVDGELVLVSYAGVEHKAGAYQTLVPSELKIAAETRFKAGLNAVITGKDLDLVTGAALAGTALEYVYADGAIAFTIPAAAVDGTVTLTLANGKTVDTEAVELVKPVISEVTPGELYAGDENVTVKGEDLDLVTAVTLGGRETEFNVVDDKTIEIVTSQTSVSGKVVLTLANAVTVESEQEVKVNYHSLVIVSEMPAGQHIGQEVVLKGSNFSLVENIFIGDTKVTQYSLRTDEEVRFLMPWCVAGMYSMSFHLFSGDVETVATQIEVKLELDIKTIWEGSERIEWGGMSALSWGGYDWSTVKPGTILTAYFTQDEAPAYTPQIRFGNGSWASIPSGLEIAPGEGNIPLDPSATYYSIKLTAADIDMLVNQGGLVMTGTFYTITSLTLSTEISQEVTIWEGEADPQSWAVNLELGPADNAGWRDNGLQVGQTVKIYFNLVTPDSWAVQIFNGHWTGMSFPDPVGGQFNQGNWDASLGYISFEVTDAIYALLTESAGWGTSLILQGSGVIFTKIAFI